MEYSDDKHYLREIDHVSVLESIDEIFDGATSLLTQNAIMYGSSVTALIAGLPIVGDLDVAVSKQEFMKLSQNFASSVKWVQVDGTTIHERQPQDGSIPNRFTHPSLKKKSDNYRRDEHLPISNVVAFQTVNDSRVQIVESKEFTGDPFEDALAVLRKVDFSFCGMGLDRYGRMLETIPRAYSDCLHRIIRIRDYQARLDEKRMVQRIRKYTKRGWYLSMSIDQARLNLRRAQEEHKKAFFDKYGKKGKPTKKLPSCFRIKKSKKYHTTIEVTNAAMQAVMTGSIIADIVMKNAKKLGIPMNINKNTFGAWTFQPKVPVQLETLKQIVDMSNADLMKYHKVTPSLLRKISGKDKALKKLRQKKVSGGRIKASKSYGSTSTATTYISTSTSSGNGYWS